MARMFPPNPEFGDGRRGEERVYNLLEKGLHEDAWSVFYNVQFQADPHGIRTREIDFIVLHPKRGCLFLEVKGGQHVFDEQHGWCSVYGTQVQPHTNPGGPYGQITSAAHEFLDTAATALDWRKGYLPVKWGTGVVFPHCTLRRIDGRLPADAEGGITAEEAQCDSPEAFRSWVLGRFDDIQRAVAWSRPQDEGANQLRRFLAPRVESFSRLASQIARYDELEDHLTAVQKQVVRMMQTRRRVLIGGYAGTGKTFMAVYQAIRLADAARRAGRPARIAILCFNRNLAEMIQAEMMPSDSGIEVAHFHALADRIAEGAGVPAPANYDQEYFDTGCVERILEAWGTGKVRPYDAIIVDEAQDFRPEWIELLEETLLVDSGHLTVFYDPLQDIYGVGPHLRERFGQPYPITLNCRNTVSICDFFRATLPDQLQDLEPVPEALQGQKPRVIAYKDPDDERRRMETLIGELMGDHGLKPQQIMLLSPYTRPKTCLADVEGLCGCKLVDYEKRYSTRGGRTLFYETVMSFKGLDAAVVILHDVKPGDFATDPKMLYVAFSRARVALFVFKDRQIKLPSEAA